MIKSIKVLLLSLILSLSITSCNKEAGSVIKENSVEGVTNVESNEKVEGDGKSIVVEGEDFPFTVTDFSKEKTTIEKEFERPAVLSGTPLNIWYDLGGKSVCTSDISENLKLKPEYEDEVKSLPEIGPVYSINMEAVLEENPDLIVAQLGTQTTQAKKFREMGYDVITTHIRGYKDVLSTYEAFGKLLGKEDLAKERIKQIELHKKEILDQLPNEKGKSMVILYISGNTFAAKLNNSIAGDIGNILNLENIAADLPPDTIGSEHTPLDVEYIVEKNPEYVFVTSMVGSNEDAREMMEKEFTSNPIWEGVDAIKEDKVIYLPQQYFLFNAGPYYGDAIEYMARSVYPEIYGKVSEKYGE